MTVTVSYPGVYVEEDNAPTVSINSGTPTVPAFSVYMWNAGAIKINSYAEYLSVRQNSGSPAQYDDALKAYFQNGGGACYMINSAELEARVREHDEINLLVTCETYGIDSASSCDLAIANLCQPGSTRFAVVDGPKAEITNNYDPGASYSANSNIAVYYPALQAGWATYDICPSAVMAGVYCATDRTRGVWSAPANVLLQGGLRPKYKVTDDLQGQFNQGLAINMIRDFGSGPTVWGARTLEDSDNWRYVPVRRLFNAAERDIGKAMQSMLFEPNSAPTWERVRTAINNYLHSLWQQGALAGTGARDAYFVQIGEGVTMTADDIAQGRMIASVGMAAVRPAEFIVLQFTQNMVSG